MKARWMTAVAVFFGGLATAVGPLAAQTVYRCGNAYSDIPCPQAAVVDADDARNSRQQAEARDVARREAALASRMTADRQREEAQAVARPVRAVRVKSAAASASAPVRPLKRNRLRAQDNGQGDFVAYVPRAPKK